MIRPNTKATLGSFLRADVLGLEYMSDRMMRSGQLALFGVAF